MPDARKHGIHPWPYLVACLGVGSIGALGYIVHREVRRAFPARAATSV